MCVYVNYSNTKYARFEPTVPYIGDWASRTSWWRLVWVSWVQGGNTVRISRLRGTKRLHCRFCCSWFCWCGCRTCRCWCSCNRVCWFCWFGGICWWLGWRFCWWVGAVRWWGTMNARSGSGDICKCTRDGLSRKKIFGSIRMARFGMYGSNIKNTHTCVHHWNSRLVV